MKIWFDMDGTIADLYAVDGWLDDIIAENTRPYECAEVLHNMSLLARLLNKVQKNGHEIGIISWTARDGKPAYNDAVAIAKRDWLNKHLPSVRWNTIKVVEYGTNKYMACGGGILFDDEIGNREIWGAGAHEPREIMEVLKGLTR